MTKKIFLSSFAIIFFLAINSAQAASLYFKIDNNSKSETKSILTVDTGADAINTIGGKISYDSASVDCTAMPTANSIMNIWITRPYAVNGEVIFAGIIPGGYAGTGEIISITCKPKNGQNMPILALDKNVLELLLNDGTGKSAAFSIAKNEMISPAEHQALTEKNITDNLPPEITSFEISKNTALAENNFLLIFNAVDKQSGISAIAVSASDKKLDAEKDFKIITETLPWTDAQSPFVMPAEFLSQYIYLKVTDQSGNIKLARLSPVKPWWEINLISIMFLLIISVLAAIIFIVLKLKGRK